MARPVSGEAGPLVIKDKSVIINDCGASATITGSLINTSETSERITIIETADGRDSMTASHKCLKTYFLRNRTGEVTKITVPAVYVKGLPQDLLGGKTLNRNAIRVILDSDPDICGYIHWMRIENNTFKLPLSLLVSRAGTPICTICRPKKWTGQLSRS
jgi:hypothetical protein